MDRPGVSAGSIGRDNSPCQSRLPRNRKAAPLAQTAPLALRPYRNRKTEVQAANNSNNLPMACGRLADVRKVHRMRTGSGLNRH